MTVMYYEQVVGYGRRNKKAYSLVGMKKSKKFRVPRRDIAVDTVGDKRMHA